MGGESAMEIKYSENMFKVPDAAAAIRDYASQGFDIVIAHGSQYGSSVQEIAKDFPKTTFAWGTDVNTFGLPNVYAYTAAAEEGGYVNGVMAAMLTKSKKIGVTGPVEVGDAKTYIDGFTQGVASVDPEHQGLQDLDRLLLGCGPDDRSRQDPHRRRRRCPDRFVAVGGRLDRRGQREAGNVLWFGTQSDQTSLAPNLVVASQVYDWTGDDQRDHCEPQVQASWAATQYKLQLNNDGLKIAFNSGYSLPADVKAAADKAIEGIKSGAITVQP